MYSPYIMNQKDCRYLYNSKIVKEPFSTGGSVGNILFPNW